MFRLGLVSISFRDKTPLEIIKAAADAGLSCIEWGSDVHAPFSDTKKLTEIKKECEANGITCCSYGTYYRIGQNTDSEIMPYIEAAKILGTDVLRLWGGTVLLEFMPDGKIESLAGEAAALRKITEVF